MTDKRQSDALRLAGIADDGPWTFVIGVRKEIAAELRRQYAEIETLRTGYEAARLEIESLKARPAGAPQPSPAARGDALDAARYRYLRDVPMDQWPAELLTAIRLQQNAKWDTIIDAARKQGANHD